MKTININNEVYVLESDVKKELAKKNVKLKPFSVDNPPKEEEHYFYVGGEYELKVCNVLWFKEDGTDISNLTQGNCFRTKEEAEAALSRVLQALKS